MSCSISRKAASVFLCIVVPTVTNTSYAIAKGKSRTPSAGSRLSQEPLYPIYRSVERKWHIPWNVLAAIDRYAQSTKPKNVRAEAPYYGFAFKQAAWAGIENPTPSDLNPYSIHLFRGIGLDANGDHLALPWDQQDRINALAKWLHDQTPQEDVDTSIWNLFQNPVAVERVNQFSRLFRTYGTNLNNHCFPLDKRYNYSIVYSFGAGRSFGGARQHEGVDIFADYGTPALAPCYGYVELKGWNRLGGWRLGIRDTNNMYYYYAHLSRFAGGLRIGDLVRPGQVIGYVGSTGYGPPGTSGRFPPHLHFGVYRDFGAHEWAFNPSPLLARWKRLPQKVYKN